FRIREEINAIDKEDRFSLHADIAGIQEVGGYIMNEMLILLLLVVLSDEDLMLRTIPAACPVFVCPAQTEGQVEIRIGTILVKWTFEKPFSREPVIVETKAIDPVFFGELHLAFLYFGKSKIIITQFIRQVRLIMTIKIGKSP